MTTSKPPAWKCILDEAIYTIAADPAFSGGNWSVRDVLIRIVKLGLVAANAEMQSQHE